MSNSADSRIFVQIAAYRDPELVPTLRDLFAKSKISDNIKVCIAWQCEEKDSLQEFANDPRVEYIKIDYKESIQGSQFVIKNPQATATCGCGSSFAI